MAVHEITHPLVRHKLGLLRERDISIKDFRELASEVGMLLAYEATRNLPVERVTIDSWAGPISVDRIKGKKMTIVPILRAGLGMMDGVLKALRMRINGVMEAGAAIPLAERRRQFPFTPMTTGTLLLTRDELMDVQQRINGLLDEYLRLSEQRRGSDYEYQVSYAWSLLPSNPAAVVGEDVDAGGSAEDDCDDR